jgi:hypothetical protein
MVGDSTIYVDNQLVCPIDLNTIQYPVSEQFDVFRNAYQNVLEIDLVRSQDASFPARQMVWDLGRMVFASTELPGKGYSHRRRHLKKSTLDHWYVMVPVQNAQYFMSDLKLPIPSLHCLARPFEAEMEDDEFLTLFVPNDLLSSVLTESDMRSVRVDGGCGLLLANYLLLLKRSLPGLRITEVPHVFEATRHLIAACLAPSRDRFAESQRPIDTVILEQVRKYIAQKLADRDLTPETLCAGLERIRIIPVHIRRR